MDLFAPSSGNFLQQIDATARTEYHVAGHAPQSGEYVAKHPGNLYLKEKIVLQCKLPWAWFGFSLISLKLNLYIII